MDKNNKGKYFGSVSYSVKPVPAAPAVPAKEDKKEPDFDADATALGRLMKDVRTARLKGYPFVLLDTVEMEVVRDVAYDLRNPVSPCKVSSFGAVELLEGDENAVSPAECVNVVWKDFENSRVRAAKTGYNTEGAPTLFVMSMLGQNNAADTLGEKLQFLRDFAISHYLNRADHSYVLLYGDPSLLPQDLSNATYVVDVPYPRVPEIEWRIRQRLKRSHLGEIKNLSEKQLNEKIAPVAQRMRGLTYPEVDHLADYLLIEYRDGKSLFMHTEDVWKKAIAQHKQQSLKRNGNLLELMKDEKLEIRGMDRLKQWVKDNKYRIAPESAHTLMKNAGVSTPKGILLHGTPGCGKTEVAKLLQQKWGLPLLKMDMGRLMGGLLGDSERMMRNALRQAEACSPCILFIDEIEKALSGISGGNNSNDSVRRMISYLLNWLSNDRGEDACFVYCTANSLDGLPKELYRKGRLDMLFSVSMPTCNECVDIFLAQLENKRQKACKARGDENYRLFQGEEAKWKEDIRKYLIEGVGMSLLQPAPNSDQAPKVVREPLFVSGADIAEIVNQALLMCYAKEETNAPLEFTDFIAAAQKVISDSSLRTTGSGEGNLKALAKGCVNTMRGAFIPVSADDEVLFDPDDYSVEEVDKNGYKLRMVRIKDGGHKKKYMDKKACSPYDYALYQALIRHIEEMPEPEEKL